MRSRRPEKDDLASPRPDAPRRYVMLMASLPALGTRFPPERTPVSRAKLDRRLGMLAASERDTLWRIERAVQWEAVEADQPDRDLAARAEDLVTALNSARLIGLADAIDRRLQMRRAVAALRHRHAGRGAPAPADAPWGPGRLSERIAAGWNQPDLGLGRTFRWIGRAQELLEADDPAALERLLLGAAWDDLAERAGGHRFDFTAVALYVLFRDIADRWSRMDGEAARERFDALVAEALPPLSEAPVPDVAHG
jgi:hypothetical protein